MRTLTIYRGFRFSWPRMWPWCKEFHNEYSINQYYWYTSEAIRDTGWDKLDGLSSLFIHTNSVRVVIRPDHSQEGYIRYAFYRYVNGEGPIIEELFTRHYSIKPRIKMANGYLELYILGDIYKSINYEEKGLKYRTQFHRKEPRLPKTWVNITKL